MGHDLGHAAARLAAWASCCSYSDQVDVGNPVNFKLPPVIEVAMGVQFEAVAGLGSFRSGELFQVWRDLYPHVSEQAELPRWPDFSTAGAETQLFLQLAGRPAARLWLASPRGDFLLQLQADRFIVNWRRTGSGSYPRYATVRERFEATWSDVERVAGPLPVDMVEVTYVNQESRDPRQVLAGWDNPLCAQLEGGLEAVFEEPVELAESTPALRVTRVNGRHGEQPGTQLTLTVRAKPLDTRAPLVALDAARWHIVNRFRDITSPAMHEQWGDEA